MGKKAKKIEKQKALVQSVSQISKDITKDDDECISEDKL